MNKNESCRKLLNIKHFRRPAPPKSLISKYLQKNPASHFVRRGNHMNNNTNTKLRSFF